MSENPTGLGDLLDRIEAKSDNSHRITVGEMADAIGARTFAPFIIVPAMIEISPIGGIPTVPTILALIVMLFSLQMAIGKKHLWIPARLERTRLPARRVSAGVRKMRPVARFLDRWVGYRFPALTNGRMSRIAAIACILLACLVPPLEVVPFATTVPMAAIAILGLALLVRDGLLLGIGLTVSLAAVAVAVSVAGRIFF